MTSAAARMTVSLLVLSVNSRCRIDRPLTLRSRQLDLASGQRFKLATNTSGRNV
jgi:hypothetical protein